jgi:hypothetical protein
MLKDTDRQRQSMGMHVQSFGEVASWNSSARLMLDLMK